MQDRAEILRGQFVADPVRHQVGRPGDRHQGVLDGAQALRRVAHAGGRRARGGRAGGPSMGHQGAGPGQLLGRVLDAYLGAALDPVQDRVLEGRLLELARLREEARRAGKHDGEPLPALFVILDEFSELLSDKPDFIEVFVAIGRLGRSMQIHLLLSSQRLEECRLHGLESHLSYRIGLRTFSAAESRIVPGAADAYDLPPYPGSGYLKSGTREMTRLWACYVAGQPPERVNAALAPAPPISTVT